MSTVEFRVTDRDGFLFGLLCNVITLQWWTLKPYLQKYNAAIDFTDPAVIARCAEMVVDLVIKRFGSAPAAGDMKVMRADLIRVMEQGIADVEESPPMPPKLRLV